MLIFSMVLAFFATFLSVAPQGRKVTPYCISVAEVVENLHPDRYTVDDGIFFVTGEVMPNDESFAGATVIGKLSWCLASQLRGKEQFKKILAHFDGRFDQIADHWSAQVEEELADNLETFNRLTGEPNRMDPKKAALETWTGKQAVEAEYTEVTVKKLDGTPGNYTNVEVRFRKKEIK